MTTTGPADMKELVDEATALWRELREALDARQVAAANGNGARYWNSAITYAHLDHWQRYTVESLTRRLAGLPELEELDREVVNDRWAGEDTGLSLTEARRRCVESRAKLLSLATATGELAAINDHLIDHVREHLGYLRG